MFRKQSYKFLITLLFIFSLIESSTAIEPEVFVQSTVNRASEVLGNNSTKEEKIEQIKLIAKDTVDIRGIGFYSLGSHRKNLSDDKKKEFLEIFSEYFLKSFASRLAEYSNPKISVNSQKKINEKYTMVSSLLVATDDKPEISIDWRINTKDPKNLKIIDVVIEGVSLAKVQKEEFNSIMQSNDNNIDVLFQSLQDFVDKK